MQRKLLSIVIPIYNESESIGPLYNALQATAQALPYDVEYIFVDDGSTDSSRHVLADLERHDSRVRIVEFSRNFGKEIALTAGLRAARGAAALTMDADLQHPVELIPTFIDKWQAGSEVVVGVRRSYGKESVAKRLTSWLFYKLLAQISDTPVVPHATDFRLVDRVVLDAFGQFSERNRMTRGLIDWLGFRRDYVSFVSADRRYGAASYSYRKLFGLALNSFVGMSLVPLRLAGWLGLVITTLAGAAGIFMLIEDWILGDPLGLDFSGPAMLAVLNMFWIGIILVALGLIALYIAHIHAEVINRPLYVVRPQPAERSNNYPTN